MRKVLNISYTDSTPDELVFKTEADQQCLDVFLPDENHTGISLFLIHGGGWTSSNRTAWHSVSEYFCARGRVCVSVGYRLAPEHRFPTQFEDVRSAFAFMKSRAAEFGFDPQKVVAMGSSAGGHLAALLATTADNDPLGATPSMPTAQTRPAAVIGLCPAFSVLSDAQLNVQESVTALLGGSPEEEHELAHLASPVEHVTKDTPPFLIITGDDDDVTPLAHQEHMVGVLRSHGVPVELVVLPGVGHGYGYGVESWSQKEMLAHTERFLRKLFECENVLDKISHSDLYSADMGD
jgi:acetyl esterase/lipase